MNNLNILLIKKTESIYQNQQRISTEELISSSGHNIFTIRLHNDLPKKIADASLLNEHIDIIFIEIDEDICLKFISKIKPLLSSRPLIMTLSKNSNTLLAQNCFNNGVDNFILMPLTEEKLKSAISFYNYSLEKAKLKPYNLAMQEIFAVKD